MEEGGKMKRFLLIFLILGTTIMFAQEKQEIPTDFFMGKWGGSIQYDAKFFDNKGRIMSHHTSSLKNINIDAGEYDDEDAVPIETFKNMGYDSYTAEWMSSRRNQFNGNAVYTSLSKFYDNKGILYETWELKNGTENIEISGDFISNNRIYIADGNDQVEIWRGTYFEEFYPFSLGGAAFALTILEGIDFRIENNTLLINYEGKPLNFDKNGYITITGELYRIYTKKDTLGKTIQIDESIKTDKFTQREIVVPAIIKVPEFPYKTGELYVFNNTNCIFTSKNELYLGSGEIVVFEDKNWWEKVDINKVVSEMKTPNKDLSLEIIMGEIEISGPTKVRSPQAVLATRGTQFITKVKDGTTILTVLDGEVEFSDINKKKTVIVKKNQKSMCETNGLPTEPETIDIEQILKWWE